MTKQMLLNKLNHLRAMKKMKKVAIGLDKILYQTTMVEKKAKTLVWQEKSKYQNHWPKIVKMTRAIPLNNRNLLR